MTPGQRDAVVTEAASWLLTPYHSHARLKGVGVDCAMLLACVYANADIIADVDPGYYPEQFGLHRDEEQFMAFVERYAVEIDGPMLGDCVLFKFGRCYSHGGIMVSETRLIHAAMPEKMVVYADLSDANLIDRRPRFFTIKD